MPVPTIGAWARKSGTDWRCHVGTHQGSVRVVVLKERNQRSSHRNKLLRADVDVVDFFPVHQHKVSGLAGVHQLGNDASLVVQLDVRLGDDVTVFLPSRQIERERFDLRGTLAALLEIGVDLLDFVFFDVIPDLTVAVARVDDADVVDHARVLDFPVRRLDKPVVVDAGVTAQRRDQTDVRTFRRLNRADAAVVRRVYVADFESSAFARQTARPQGRETPLVRDLRQRVGLIHELRELRGSKELADGRHHRLRVDQIVRHGGRHFLVHAHLFLDGALHADQADAELVLHQLTDARTRRLPR